MEDKSRIKCLLFETNQIFGRREILVGRRSTTSFGGGLFHDVLRGQHSGLPDRNVVQTLLHAVITSKVQYIFDASDDKR